MYCCCFILLFVIADGDYQRTHLKTTIGLDLVHPLPYGLSSSLDQRFSMGSGPKMGRDPVRGNTARLLTMHGVNSENS